MPLFTLFTGTYFSEQVIHRVFESLEKQTFRDFEWIVIDDCSTDGTVALVEAFMRAHPDYAITLIRHTRNTGVGISRREALEKARGTYFITWDHDDEQSPDQLACFQHLWQQHDAADIGCIQAKVQNQHGNVLGKMFPAEVYCSDYISMHNSYLVGSLEKGNAVEHHVCSKTAVFLDVLKYYESHPELTGGQFPSGGDVWAMMAYRGYRTLYSNTVVRRYYVAEAGRSSMSSGGRLNKASRIYYHKLLWVNFFNSRMPDGEWLWKWRMLFGAIMYGFLAGRSFPGILRDIRPGGYKILTLLIAVPAYYKSRQYAGK